MEWYQTVALVLFGVGIVALVAEFLMPTAGILVVVALTAFASSVGVLLMYGSRYEAAAGLVGAAVGIPAVSYLVATTYKRFSLSSALTRPETGPDTSAADGSNLALLKGQIGQTASPLRPGGVAVFDGRRVDAISEGPMLDANTYVKCVGVRGTSLVVRPVETPAPLRDLNLDGLDGLN